MTLEYFQRRNPRKNKRREWHWRLKNRGRIIAVSGEGYVRKDHTQYMANRICGHLLDAHT